MKFIRKIKDFFALNQSEEEMEYDEEHEIENEIDENRQQVKNNEDTINRQSKFRFPLIEDGQEVDNAPTQQKHEKKSAVFFDAEQQSGVKLPSHLPQQSLVYEVEVSNIAELLAKRNKTHGKQSIVRYEQSSLRPSSKQSVTSAERQFLTKNPQREDIKETTVNKELMRTSPLKRFVPTDVPSPVHGFNKAKSIEELMPNLAERQNEAKIKSEQKSVLNASDEWSEEAIQQEVNQDAVNQENKEAVVATEVTVITDKAEAPTKAEVIETDQTAEKEDIIVAVPPMDKAAVQMEEKVVAPEMAETTILETTTLTSAQSVQPDDNEKIQELAVQHFVIENSTVHIEQLNVEQAPTSNEDKVIEQVAEQKNGVQGDHGEKQTQANLAKGSRIPFNVVMLDSDKKKLESKAEQQEIKKVPIYDWKGDIINSTMDQKEENRQPLTAIENNHQKVVEQEQTGSSPFQPEQRAEEVERMVHAAMESSEKLNEQASLHSVAVQVLEKPETEMAFEEKEVEIITDQQAETDVEEIEQVHQLEEAPLTNDEFSLGNFEQQLEVPLANTTKLPNQEPEAVFIPYEKPSTEFLISPEERTEDWPWLDEQAEYLIAALASHQVQAQIESIEQGPAVTQFEITVAQGTKVSKVRNLTDDIKLALAAKDIRVEAPIPGKRTIGIEVPNRVSRAVRLSEVTNSDSFIHSNSPLEAALGLDLSGKPVTIDLCKMPHGLIAGATGSGKSVCINSILVSLLYKADPNELKLMLIDPKMVELAPFNKIPHLVSPVITDVKAATAALKWAVEEMERRYELFMHAGVRDIKKFNQQAEKAKQYAQKMPYILIVIDELADLMMMSPADVEEAICRITQKARACGIHLIVATQRPSVDVITGLIKSNIPTRIAFAVSSGVDSRTILDVQGAERLLGRGDMLYLGNGMNAPIRLQGTFVTDEEIEDIIAYVRSQGEPNYLFAQEDLLKRAEIIEEQDELFEEVCRYVYEVGTASTSSVQRNFHIGYNRAARLIEMLEKKGFVSEARGSKPREVFINESDLDELFS